MAQLSLYSMLAFLLTQLCPSTAQLIGSLTRCDHNPDLIMAVITNTHTRHVSVLKHNTIFDTSHLSVPFTITDASGTHLPLGGFSHLFYSGVAQGDFLDLAPGVNFTRHLNLTKYVALEPEGSDRFRTIRISLPSVFRGLKGHNGIYDVHSAANGQMIDGQLRLSEVSKANLTFISHTSTPFEITLPVPSRRPRPKTRRDPPAGIHMIPTSCNPSDAAKASTGILHASYLAGAALNAASQFGTPPFNYFFPATSTNAGIVAGVMNRVIASQLGQGQHIGVSCTDLLRLCQSRRGVINAYAAQRPGVYPSIILCPHGLTLPPNPPPCSGPPGTVSIGWLLLHEMSHIRGISGPGLEVLDTAGELAKDVGDAVRAGKDTTNDANAYSYLGTWAWDLGFGGQPWMEDKVCLERFSTGQFRAYAGNLG